MCDNVMAEDFDWELDIDIDACNLRVPYRIKA